MNNRQLQIILVSLLVLLTISTVAYAYVGPALGPRVLRYGMVGGDVSAINGKQNPPQNTALGGGIGIHGGVDTNGTNDWTYGCIALSETDVHEIFEYIRVGTSLSIQN
jgi:hypothetical protein